MPKSLPPLNALRLFEAAGRHLSFKQAAAELHRSPSAVSHAIRALEDHLGVALFRRGPRGLALSEAGAAYLPEVRDALDRLAAATAALPGPKRKGAHLALSVAPSFGLRWLIPRLPAFSEKHPGIEVTLDTDHCHVDFGRVNTHLAIRMGRGDWPDLYADNLLGEELVPVCAPALAPAVRRPADLAQHSLLQVTSVSEDWAAWARLAGIDADALDLEQGPRFDNIDMALKAAAAGLGIAIGRRPLIDADLAAGRLVQVLGPPRRAATAYWLTGKHDTLQRPAAACFRDWICGELNESAADTAPAPSPSR
ncbi:transcriptional regulator GcvA [Pelagibius litoralis]|uniref:Transcriptional regulator GcvA n=1 Tax=Pelagibius litoralis TaxID=374515 RepID=A0A967EZ53_9PROT|nr:transcriptional regulator GcvA [Pelagibius litoralis]NIA70069.1 transcriptional regulator GcvA [Pelagibius litoralis]